MINDWWLTQSLYHWNYFQVNDDSVHISMDAMKEITETHNNQKKAQHCRRPSDLTINSLLSDSTASTASACSDSSCSGDDQQQQRRNNNKRTRTRRKKDKKEPEDLVAKAVSQMNMSVEEQNRYLALDCEMVGVGYRGKGSALARVTIVDWNHNVVLDEYVKPTREVTDYRTFVSGITQEILEQSATLDWESCRQKVLSVLEGQVLVGHGLKNDLRALDIQLPWYAVRDTAKYEPFMKARFDDGVLWPQSLRLLAKNRLRREIQLPGEAHSPIEDAATAMDLYKIARKKWEMAMDYKISKTRSIEQQTQR